MSTWQGTERRDVEKRRKGFYGLRVWEEAHAVVRLIYRHTAGFPKDEMFGLTQQIRRAAVSIPANIAEGFGRGGKIEFRRFLRISRGSAYELEYLILLSRDVGYLEETAWRVLAGRMSSTQRMLNRLIQRLV